MSMESEKMAVLTGVAAEKAKGRENESGW